MFKSLVLNLSNLKNNFKIKYSTILKKILKLFYSTKIVDENSIDIDFDIFPLCESSKPLGTTSSTNKKAQKQTKCREKSNLFLRKKIKV
jgi:hypothetical protein